MARRVVECLTTPTGQEGRTREAWRGHRRVTYRLKVRPIPAERVVQTRQRALDTLEGAGRRGPAVDPWTRSTVNLGKACRVRGIGSAVDAIAHELATTEHWAGPDGIRVTIANGRVSSSRGQFGLLEYARRLALYAVDRD